jgi:hypothetical protein
MPIVTSSDPTDQQPVARQPITKHPVAWLQPMPQGFKIPIWRWILLPATALMLKRNGGVWISGEVSLFDDQIVFAQSRMIKSRSPAAQWALPLPEIGDVIVRKGIASETIELHQPSRIVKLISVRSEEFVARLRQTIAAPKHL